MKERKKEKKGGVGKRIRSELEEIEKKKEKSELRKKERKNEERKKERKKFKK